MCNVKFVGGKGGRVGCMDCYAETYAMIAAATTTRRERSHLTASTTDQIADNIDLSLQSSHYTYRILNSNKTDKKHACKSRA